MPYSCITCMVAISIRPYNQPQTLLMASMGSGSVCSLCKCNSLGQQGHALEALLTVATAVAFAPWAEAVANACMNKQEHQMVCSSVPEQLQHTYSHWPMPAREPEDQLQQTQVGSKGFQQLPCASLLEMRRAQTQAPGKQTCPGQTPCLTAQSRVLLDGLGGSSCAGGGLHCSRSMSSLVLLGARGRCRQPAQSIALP